MTHRFLPLAIILAACASSPPPVAAPEPAPAPVYVAPTPEPPPAPPPAPAAVLEPVAAPPEPEIPPGLKPEPPAPPPKLYTEAEASEIVGWIEWVEDHCELRQPESIITQGVCNPVCPPPIRVWPCAEYSCPKGTKEKWIEFANKEVCRAVRGTGTAKLVGDGKGVPFPEPKKGTGVVRGY